MDIKIVKKIGIGVLGVLLLTAIVVSFLQPRQRQEQLEEEAVVKIEADLSSIFAGEMGFIFFEDKNANGRYDYEDKVFKNVSVAVQRPGEQQPFVTVAADVNGVVKISNLAEGDYAVQYLNKELEQPVKEGDFIFRPYYEITEGGTVRYSFLPSEWQTVKLTGGGYKAKVGLRPYLAKSVLAIREGRIVKFYDPAKAKVLGQSDIEGVLGTKLDLRDGRLIYLNNESLKQFDFKNRITVDIMSGLVGFYEQKYWLSPQVGGLIFAEEGRDWHYQNEVTGCDAVPVSQNQERLKISQKISADWLDETTVAVNGETPEEPAGVYIIKCLQGKLQAVNSGLNQVDNLHWLDEKTIFYSDSGGSYFYNLETKQPLKYTALGKGESLVVSADRKYLSGRVGATTVIVDYPAVRQSQVEKHYQLPYSGQIAFSGDEVLVNQTKACETDGDCGEIIRISLQGNGVWEISDRIQLKDIYADEVLGEIKL